MRLTLEEWTIGMALAAGCILGIRPWFRVWRGDSGTLAALRKNLGRSLLVPAPFVKHFIRSSGLSLVGCIALTVGYWGIALQKLLGREHVVSRVVLAPMILAVFLAFVIILGLTLSVLLFNRPRFATPPWARGEPGLLTKKGEHDVPANRDGDGS